MARFATILAFLAAASLSFAAPSTNGEAEIEKRGPTHSGRGTFYNTQTGNQVACGGYYQNTDYIVAGNPTAYNNGARCGKRLTAHYGGKSVSVTLVDECPTCGPGSLDFSKAAFKVLAPLSVGDIPITWAFDD